jgi:hypothetical protein
MRRFHFYDAVTGVLNQNCVVINAPNADVAAAGNCPPGHKTIEGTFDYLSQAVDVTTGQVIAYQPPQPTPDYEWNATDLRWRLTAAVAAKQQASAAALAAIETLEGKGIRAMRELALGMAGAQERVAAIDAQIATLRENL